MNTNMTNEMKEGFKPMLNMLDIQTRTAQKLMREQMNFMNECLEVSSQQSDALRDSDDQTRFFRVPIDTGREIGERWNSVMSRQWDILVEARDAMTGEVQSVAKNAESTIKQASQEADKAASDIASKAKISTRKDEKDSTSAASKS